MQADVSDAADTVSLDASYHWRSFTFIPPANTVNGNTIARVHFVNKDAGGHIAVVSNFCENRCEKVACRSSNTAVY